MAVSKEFIDFLTTHFPVWKKESERTESLRAGTLKLDADWCGQILRLAADKGSDSIITELLNYSASIGLKKEDFINTKDPSGNTAIIRAAARGHVKAFLVLYQAGASLYRRNAKYNTALALAFQNKRTELLKAFFDLKPKLSYYDEYGNSIIECAIYNDQLDFAQSLVQQGIIDINQSLRSKPKPEEHWDFNSIQFRFEPLTPLVRVIRTLHNNESTHKNFNNDRIFGFKLAQGLLAIGADPSLRCEAGVTPFSELLPVIGLYATWGIGLTEYPKQTTALLNALVSKRLNPLNDTEHFESDLFCALRSLFKAEHQEIRNDYNAKEQTKIIDALLETLQSILKNCTDINHVDKKAKVSALMLAVQHASKAVPVLLAAGANVLVGVGEEGLAENSLTVQPYDLKEEKEAIESQYIRDQEYYESQKSSFSSVHYMDESGPPIDPLPEKIRKLNSCYDRSLKVRSEQTRLLPMLCDRAVDAIYSFAHQFPKEVTRLMVHYAYLRLESNEKKGAKKDYKRKKSHAASTN